MRVVIFGWVLFATVMFVYGQAASRPAGEIKWVYSEILHGTVVSRGIPINDCMENRQPVPKAALVVLAEFDGHESTAMPSSLMLSVCIPGSQEKGDVNADHTMTLMVDNKPLALAATLDMNMQGEDGFYKQYGVHISMEQFRVLQAAKKITGKLDRIEFGITQENLKRMEEVVEAASPAVTTQGE